MYFGLKTYYCQMYFTVGEYRITSNGSKESLEKAMEESSWKRSLGNYPMGEELVLLAVFSSVAVPYLSTGMNILNLWYILRWIWMAGVLITSGASDIGQGSDTMLALIVGEVLGLSRDQPQGDCRGYIIDANRPW